MHFLPHPARYQSFDRRPEVDPEHQGRAFKDTDDELSRSAARRVSRRLHRPLSLHLDHFGYDAPQVLEALLGPGIFTHQ